MTTRKTRLTVLILAAVLLTGFTTAADNNGYGLETTYKTGLQAYLQVFVDSVFAVTAVPEGDVFNPGETVSGTIWADGEDVTGAVNSGDEVSAVCDGDAVVLITELVNPDGNVAASSSRLIENGECIEQSQYVTYTLQLPEDADTGDWTVNVDYRADRDPATARRYDFGSETFTVQRSTVEEPAEIVQTQPPRVEVQDSKVVGTVYFKNVGGEMSGEHGVEMQVRESGSLSALLSTVSGSFQCNPSTPDVAKTYMIDPGDTVRISLESGELRDGTYETIFYTGKGSCEEGRVTATEPYPNGRVADRVVIGDNGGNTSATFAIALIVSALLAAGWWFFRG